MIIIVVVDTLYHYIAYYWTLWHNVDGLNQVCLAPQDSSVVASFGRSWVNLILSASVSRIGALATTFPNEMGHLDASNDALCFSDPIQISTSFDAIASWTHNSFPFDCISWMNFSNDSTNAAFSLSMSSSVRSSCHLLECNKNNIIKHGKYHKLVKNTFLALALDLSPSNLYATFKAYAFNKIPSTENMGEVTSNAVLNNGSDDKYHAYLLINEAVLSPLGSSTATMANPPLS